MCPGCLATLIAAETTPAGGLTALVMTMLGAGPGAKTVEPTIRKTGERDESSENRVAN